MVADAYSGDSRTIVLADAHQEAVHTLGIGRGFFLSFGIVVVGNDELRKHSSPATIACGVTDVPLFGRGSGGVDDELPRRWVIGCRGLQLLHVGAVAALCHGKATKRVEIH